MPRFIKAFSRDGLAYWLVEQDVARPEVAVVDVPVVVNRKTHIIFQLDFSGSMYGSERDLKNDMKRIVRQLRVGDAVTVMHFASRGDLKVALEAYKITDAADYVFIERQIDNMYTRGCTNYTDGMRKAVAIRDKFSSVYDDAVYMFLTDGYPNDDEGRSVQLRLAAEIGSSFKLKTVVGYGDYYNKTLLADLSQAMGATFAHANEIKQFTTTVTDTLDVKDEVADGVSVDLQWPSEHDITFYVGRKQFNMLPVSDDDKTRINPMRKVDHVYTLTNRRPTGIKESTFTDASVSGDSKLESLVKASYSLGVILSQKNRTRDAKAVFRTIGDCDVIKAFQNARTLAEFGTAEQRVTFMAFNPSKRFASGRDVDYGGNPNAFNLVEMFHLLTTDPLAKIHFTDPRFTYKTRTAPRNYLHDVPKYRYVDEGTPFNKMTFNKSRINVSVFAERKVNVTLSTGETVEAIINKNYLIVCDGGMNVKLLPVSMSESSFLKLRQEGAIDADEQYVAGTVYSVYLDRLPLVNEAMTTGKNQASGLCRLIKNEFELESKLRALRFFRDEIETKAETAKTALVESIGAERADLLAKHYLKPGKGGKLTFQPATEPGVAEDKYLAVEFDVVMDGFASPAAMSDVLDKKVKFDRETGALEVINKKMEENFRVGTFTRQEYLVEGIKEYAPTAQKIGTMAGTPDMKRQMRLDWLNGYIRHLENQLKELRREIQTWKFAVMLSQETFEEPEFQARQDETVITVDGQRFIVRLSQKETAC